MPNVKIINYLVSNYKLVTYYIFSNIYNRAAAAIPLWCSQEEDPVLSGPGQLHPQDDCPTGACRPPSSALLDSFLAQHTQALWEVSAEHS